MYTTVLIATDGSDLAEVAVDHGLRLTRTVGARALFVTVTEPWPILDMAGEIERGNLDALDMHREAAERTARKILEACAEKSRAIGVEFETRHIVDYRPAEGILVAAEERDCDIIVMASHGRRGINRMLLGSQTAEVLAHTQKPVLVLR